MNRVLEDAIYFSSVAVCIAIGSTFKTIEDVDSKRSYGAGLGLLVVCLICREYFFHTILMVLGNVIIIKCASKSYVHLICLAYTLLYLTHLHVTCNVNRYTIWIFQVLALRLVGLAFEIHIFGQTSTSKEKLIRSNHLMHCDPTPMDVISYAYFFIGIHKGPYYSARVFNEYFELPYPTLSSYRTVTMDKVKKIVIGLFVYTILSWQFPLKTYYTKEFYKCSSEYRFLYNIPQIAQYLLQQQLLLALCTCVCTETGFGVYPTKCKSIAGLGPQSKHSEVRLAKDKLGDYEISDFEEFNFATIKCFDNNKIFYGPMMKDSFRGWDMATQNWFWAYIYKSYDDASKEVRSASSFLAWNVFCGPTVSQGILSTTLWICLNLESEFDNIYGISYSATSGGWSVCYSVIRAMCMIYLTPCLILDDSTLIKYYSSIYWSFHVLLLITVIVAVCLVKLKAH